MASPEPPVSSPSATSGDNAPPRPQIPPGHNSPVRTPHPHDVLSGRGGRINSHPGNVRFREKVDAHKREYLDPRTKKVEKARIAARIVGQIRALDPGGRFLKEDPHTGLWVEIGDERAWKKAGQALRESAPEIRAERQAQLQMLAAGASLGQVDSIMNAPGNNTAGSGTASGGGGGGRKKAADPPGPRHRPNPPEREGLSRSGGSRSSASHASERYDDFPGEPRPSNRQRGGQQRDMDPELARMRQEYYAMQRMQAEQQRRMLQYQSQMRGGQAGGGGNNGNLNGPFSDSYEQNVYEEYNQMQQSLMGGYRGTPQQMAADLQTSSQSMNRSSTSNQRSESSLLASEIMNEGLLPVDAGFDIPALRGEGVQSSGSQGAQQMNQQEAEQVRRYQQQMMLQQQQQQQKAYAQQQQQGNNAGAFNDTSSGGINPFQAQEAFDRHFNACDKTVSTMSSFDINSVDMSSLGGYSWNQQSGSGMLNNSNPHNQERYNQSMISTGSHTMGSNMGGQNMGNTMGGRYGNMDGANSARGATVKKSSKSGGMSALERKLEKVNEAHRRQQAQHQMMMLQQQQAQQALLQGDTTLSVPTAKGDGSRKQSQDNMQSLNSFGFDAIDEDDVTEASYKMSNLGLSEMDMTFTSEVMSVRSKSVPKQRTDEGGEGEKRKKKGSRRASCEDGNAKRSHSDGDATADANGGGGVTAASVFGSSGTSSSLSKSAESARKMMGSSNHLAMSMEDFNESFKSMEMEDRGPAAGGKAKKKMDPDGAVGGGGRYGSAGRGRRDPGGMRGGLQTIHSSRTVNASNAATKAGARRKSTESMGLSDPDMLTSQDFGQSADFGVSLNSLKSFQSTGTEGSSWLNQYNSMENVAGNPWEDEEEESRAGSIASEISAPRMITATGNND